MQIRTTFKVLIDSQMLSDCNIFFKKGLNKEIRLKNGNPAAKILKYGLKIVKNIGF